MKSLAAILLLGFAALYAACVLRNDGRFVYCVDDAYIHLALAKNLAASGTYGVRAGAFAGASSSIAWPWVLAGCARVLGVAELVPLVLGLAAALGIGALAIAVMKSVAPETSPAQRAVAAGIVLFLAPVLPVVFVGMEHVPHALAILALAWAGARGARPATLGALAAVAASLRYETWFLLGPLVLLLASRRRFVDAAAAAGGGLVPAALYAAFAHAHGSTLLPASLLLKRTHVGALALPYVAYRHLVENPHALVVLVLVAIAWSTRRARAGVARDPLQALLLLAFVTLVLHVTLAQLGWFFRYEAYALVLALTAVLAAALERLDVLRRALPMVALPLLVGTLPLTARAFGAHRAVPLASGNIADQQVTVARFLAEEASDASVAVNDIGAVTFFSSARAVDLMGLASPRVAAMRRYHIDEGLDRDALTSIARDERISLAVIYDDWFAGSIPSSFTPVARFRIQDNRVCAKDTVTFYSVAPASADELRARLEHFAPHVPPRVEASFVPVAPSR